MNPSYPVDHAEIQAELIDTLFRSVPYRHFCPYRLQHCTRFSALGQCALITACWLWLAVLYGLTVIRWLLMRAYQQTSANFSR